MKLNEKAERYYRQACGVKVSEIERWFQEELGQVEMDMFGRGMARSSQRNQAIEKLVIGRWRRLVQSRIESLLETYELFEAKLEEEDVDRFVDEQNDARSNVMTSAIHRMGEGGVSLQFTFDFDQINREAGLMLVKEMTKLERKRKKKIRRERKMAKQGDTVNIGSVSGSSIQVGGKRNTATVSNTQLNQTLNQLREVFEQSKELDTSDRDEALKKIDKLIDWTARQESPKLLEKVKNGITSLAGIASKSQELLLIAGPVIEKIKEHLPSISW